MITILGTKTRKGLIALCEESRSGESATVIASANGKKCKALHVFRREDIVDGCQALIRIHPAMLVVKARRPKHSQDIEIKVYKVCKVYFDQQNIAKVDLELQGEYLNGVWSSEQQVDLTEAVETLKNKIKMRGVGRASYIQWTTSHRTNR